MERDCGAWINLLSHKVKKRLNATLADLGITGVQSRIIKSWKKNWTRKLTMPQRLSPKRQKKLVKKSRVYFQARKNRRRGL